MSAKRAVWNCVALLYNNLEDKKRISFRLLSMELYSQLVMEWVSKGLVGKLINNSN